MTITVTFIAISTLTQSLLLCICGLVFVRFKRSCEAIILAIYVVNRLGLLCMEYITIDWEDKTKFVNYTLMNTAERMSYVYMYICLLSLKSMTLQIKALVKVDDLCERGSRSRNAFYVEIWCATILYSVLVISDLQQFYIMVTMTIINNIIYIQRAIIWRPDESRLDPFRSDIQRSGESFIKFYIVIVILFIGELGIIVSIMFDLVYIMNVIEVSFCVSVSVISWGNFKVMELKDCQERCIHEVNSFEDYIINTISHKSDMLNSYEKSRGTRFMGDIM
jgi:hypothetical protein